MNSELALLLLGCWAGMAAGSESRPADADWKTRHQQAVNRQRRIIFNNDGNEPVYYCKDATAAELLRVRTSPLAGSQVDSIFYCTWSSGFGMFTHNTKVGQVFNTREAMFSANRTREFLDRGIDPLQVMVEFAHARGIELFWSMRMNDTHDGAKVDYGPVMFRANRLKQEHPEWLIGSKDKPPRYGSWSAVDFGAPEIRDLAFRYCEEVCRNYEVDGIELDFFRHAFFFKCSGKGDACGEEELGQMTGLLQRIRKMSMERERTRGRPILLAVRVPDSVEYCRFIGIDLERWLSDKLVDLLIVGGYTQFNPWEYSVELGHLYGVKVYPSLDESRVRDEAAKELRASLATYRGRALNAWSAGADGVYLFNFFDPHSPLWRELGDPATLRKLDRSYFASVRGVGGMPVPFQKFIRVATLNPGSPVMVTASKPASIIFRVGESAADSEGPGPPGVLRLLFKAPPEPQTLRVVLNEEELPSGAVQDRWIEYSLRGSRMREGSNSLEVSFRPPQSGETALLDLQVAITPP